MIAAHALSVCSATRSCVHAICFRNTHTDITWPLPCLQNFNEWSWYLRLSATLNTTREASCHVCRRPHHRLHMLLKIVDSSHHQARGHRHVATLPNICKPNIGTEEEKRRPGLHLTPTALLVAGEKGKDRPGLQIALVSLLVAGEKRKDMPQSTPFLLDWRQCS